MSKNSYNKLTPRPTLHHPTTILRSPGGIVDCEGKFATIIEHSNKEFELEFFVVNNQTDNLLSREAASRMGLVKRVETVNLPFGELDDKPVECPPVKIVLKEDAQPYNQFASRRIPIPLLEKVKDELKRMEKRGIIEKVTEPTDWCSPIVPVLKKDGTVRICTDLKKLNTAVKREHYLLPTIEDILYKLSGSVIYSKLDATSGFYQIPLDPTTAKLTTFITPCGRYFYKRMPFGITSAPEIFQRTMEHLLRDEERVICYSDDILIHSKSKEQHEEDLQKVTDTLKKANLKLNESKCELRKSEIEFLGHIISKNGVSPDPSKVEAIKNMPDPENVTELRRLLGMINFLGKYIPNLSTLLKPVTELLEKDRVWCWGPDQVRALAKVKDLLTSSPTLAFFDPAKPTIVSCDASSYGLGGILLQKHADGLRPVAYCSRTLTSCERKYAQIEKECLAVVWTCEKFSRYLTGLPNVTVQTDHKPLVPLINYKDLQETPVRCQRMLMRLMRFSVTAEYVPGKQLVAADALSRSPQTSKEKAESEAQPLEQDVELHLNSINMTWSWAASDKRMKELKEETQKDSVLQAALHFVREGWPQYASEVDTSLRDLYAVRHELSEHEGLLTRGSRIVVPSSLRESILSKIHEGHLGINKCRERANVSVWWPLINEQIKETVSSCKFCQEKQRTQRKEPLITSDLPERPFQKCAADIFELKGHNYLVLVDYFSRYLEIAHLNNITANEVIGRMKNFFAHQGIPEILITDNGRQFTSQEFKDFAEKWNFQHVTTSPYYPQANGEAERAVQTAKRILSQPEPMLALLVYRDTPITATGKSPAQLASGRRLRTTLPTLEENLKPQSFDKTDIEERNAAAKLRNKQQFDHHHGVQPLKELRPGDYVLQKLDDQKTWSNPAVVQQQYAPRSYEVLTPRGTFRRNRRHLRPISNPKAFPWSKPSPVQLAQSESQSLSPDPVHSAPTVMCGLEGSSDDTADGAIAGNALSPNQSAGPRGNHGTDGPQLEVTTRSGRTVRRPKRFDE